MKKSHPMLETLLGLEGNPRICVFTEPLWAIPFNLYLPFASVYMLALGLGDAQIGLIASVGLFFQIFVSILSGPITDKLGRRWTTFVFDVISWSLPTFVWAIAQDFTYFLVAAILNSVLRITMNSWSLLLVEDAPRGKLVGIWSWVTIAGIFSGFFAPIAGILVAQFSLVTAVRVLYLNAFLFMTFKFVILFKYGTETRQGKIKMEETKGVPFMSLLSGYSGSFRKIIADKYTLNAFFLLVILLVNDTVKNAFWSVMVVKELALPESSIALFPLLRSVLMLAFYFFVTPRLDHLKYKIPFLAGFALILASNLALVLSPAGSFPMVILSALLDAAAVALIGPFRETIMVDAIENHDRARIVALFNVAMLVLASPSGWLAGILSERSRLYPFILLMGLSVAGIALVFNTSRHKVAFDAE